MTHNYSELFESNDATMLNDADTAITECNLWEWLKTYEPENGKGFMFSEHPNLNRIRSAMKYEDHSGGSYSWTMRTMETIAKNGWESFYNEIQDQKRKNAEKKAARIQSLNPYQVARELRGVLPDGDQQFEAMKRFSQGTLSYAEMRSLCG